MRFLVVFFFIGLNFTFSQSTEKVVDSLFREDQIYCSVSYNFLQNKPDNFSQYSFSAGLTAGVFRDFPISKNRHWSIAPGIGYSYNDLKQNIDFSAASSSSAVTIVRSRMTIHYLEVPLEIRWRNASPESHKFWRIHIGFKVSYLLGGKFIYESDAIGNGDFKIKEVANELQYGVYVAFGFNTWNPYIYYGLNPIFDKNKTTLENNVTALNVGLKFYIL
ncbi:porin family protein [Flavobacterium sp. N2820]|uniref:porin family protein n=1 Tax=Flavobacterium sp. N2820 TaxID=2986834 RepID=UPI0022256606|nr:porin family protein [Flavobacterium sp. N2820]